MTTTELLQYHTDFCAKAKAIMAAKNNDYSGSSGDTPFANFIVAEDFKICKTEQGFQLRIGDKFMRLVTFSQDGTLKVDNEGAEDSAMDIVNYLILLYAYLQDKMEANLVTRTILPADAVFSCMYCGGNHKTNDCQYRSKGGNPPDSD